MTALTERQREDLRDIPSAPDWLWREWDSRVLNALIRKGLVCQNGEYVQRTLAGDRAIGGAA